MRMKRISTIFLLAVIFTALSYFNVNAQIFSQDFGGTSNNEVNANTYVEGANTSKKQFTYISTSANVTTSIVGGKLQFDKTGSATSHFARNLDFAPTPTLVKVSFKFQCANATGDETKNQAAFMLGSGFTNNATIPAQTATHSKFGITMHDGDKFKVNVVNTQDNTGHSQMSTSYTGEKTLTFVVNNTGALQQYLAPNGSTESLDNDKWDLWVDNDKVYDDIAAYGTADDIKNFKFSMLSSMTVVNTVKVMFDDMQIHDLLPSGFLAWDFSGETEVIAGDANPTINNTNLENSVLKRGAGLNTGNAFNHTYNSTFNGARADKSSAEDNGAYFSFTVKPKTDYVMSLSSLSVKVRRLGPGPKKLQWQYSTNGTTFADLGSEVTHTVEGGDGQIIDLASLSTIDDLQLVPSGTTITFRLLGWDASNAGQFAIGRIASGKAGYSLLLNGTVQHISTLPVKLTSFTAKPSKNAVQLNWATASEQNNSHFEILRSANGEPNVVIGKVNGNGTTSIAKQYHFTDYSPLASAYYQLRQVDYNGNSEKSDVVFVNATLNQNSLTARLGNGVLVASYQSATVTQAHIAVADVNGKTLVKKVVLLQKGTNQIEIPVSLNRGLYVVKLTENGGKVQSAKLVAQ